MTEPPVQDIPDLTEHLDQLLEEKRFSEIRAFLEQWPSPEIAAALNELDTVNRIVVYRLLPRAVSAEVFSYLSPEERDDLLLGLTDQETRHILSQLTPDDRTSLFEELPAEVTQHLFGLLNPEQLAMARQLLGYPEDSVGRLMTPQYITVRRDWTVSRALEEIRRQGPHVETINTLYVVDDRGKLRDDLPLKQLLFSEADKQVEALSDDRVVDIVASEDRENAVRLMLEYDLDTLPVVDSDGVMLGIVTIDDAFDVALEEVTEDIHRTAAVEPLNMSYRKAGIWTIYSRRVIWLILLVFANLFSSGVIAVYEEALATTVALAFFIPLLIDSAGNTGSQAATMMIRALVTGDLKPSHWARVMLKELGIGLCLGGTLAVFAAILGFYRGDYQIAQIVALSMLAIIILSNLIGTILPFILHKLKIDPTVASSPLITTIADATGLLIYFSIATAILGL